MSEVNKSSIFINYRTVDTAGRAKEIYRALSSRVDVEVFFDEEEIGPGEDVNRRISAFLARAGILIVVIGSDWFTKGPYNIPRIWLDDDWVRAEIRQALAKGIPIVPVYVDDDAVKIKPEELPADIRGLIESAQSGDNLPATGPKATRLRTKDFERDLEQFIADFVQTHHLVRKQVAPTQREDRNVAGVGGSTIRAEALKKYLELEIQRRGTVRMPTGSAHRRNCQLEDIFVSLQLHAQQRTTDASTGWQDLLDDELVALTGGAGSGKSTLLNYLALRTASQCLKALTLSNRETLGYDHLQELPRVPLFVSLSSAVHKLESRHVAGGRELLAEISPENWLPVFADQLGMTNDEALLLVKSGNVHFFMDMLDEVPDPRDRVTLSEGIVKQQQQFGPLNKRNHVVVACRTAAWRDLDAATEFHQFSIEPMDSATRDEYLHKWCHLIRDDRANEVLGSLARAFRNSSAVSDIATNPQMSTMLALVGREGLPEQRTVLYDLFVTHGIRAKSLEQYGDEYAIIKYLRALAVAMQRGDSESRVPSNAVSVRAAEILLDRSLAGGKQDGQASAYQRRGESLLKALEAHTGLISVETGFVKDKTKVRFLHKTFQEYLAACHYAESDTAELIEEATNPAWSEILALTAGVLARENEPQLKSFLQALLGTPAFKNPDEPNHDEVLAYAPRVAAATVCLHELASWKLAADTLAPARAAHDLLIPRLHRFELPLRFGIVEGLGSVRDPRLTEGSRWTPVPTGKFLRGSSSRDAWWQERPMSCVHLDEFWIQTWPVTVADYQTFIDEDGYRESAWWDADGWQWRKSAEVRSPREWQQMAPRRNRPVTGVSWWEARAYCRWLTSKDAQLKVGWKVHLPTEAQWEKAARGAATGAEDEVLAEQNRFPWGSVWHPDRANWSGSLPTSELAPVGLFPAGHSPFGAWDMAGNIAERCLDGFAPYDPATTRNPLCLDYRFGHAVRGGAYDSPPLDLRVTYRFGDAPDHQDPRIGFRCAATPGEELGAMVSTGASRKDAAKE